MSPACGRHATLLVLTATNQLPPTDQPSPYVVLNHVARASAGQAASPVVSVQGHPGGCSKISRGPALHQPGTNVAPAGALA